MALGALTGPLDLTTAEEVPDAGKIEPDIVDIFDGVEQSRIVRRRAGLAGDQQPTEPRCARNAKVLFGFAPERIEQDALERCGQRLALRARVGWARPLGLKRPCAGLAGGA